MPVQALPAATKPIPKAGSLLMVPVNADHLTLLLSLPSPTLYFLFVSHVSDESVQVFSFADEAADADMSMMADVSAHLEITETKAGVDMKISNTDGEMLSMSVNKLNFSKIICYTSHLAEIRYPQKIGNGEDLIVVDQGSLYISSGVKIGGESYPRGISASASVTIFDKTGQFDAQFGDSGFTGNGSIDCFKLGALEVSAASDVTKPATFDIAMTQDEQKIKIDGMVHYHDIELLSLVDADLQNRPPMFNVHLLLKFTEQYKIDLFVNSSLDSVKSLSEANLEFSALIQGDLFDLICDGVDLFLDRMQKLADQGFDSARQKLENELSEKNKDLESLQEDLKRREREMAEHEQKRQGDLEEARRKVKEDQSDREEQEHHVY